MAIFGGKEIDELKQQKQALANELERVKRIAVQWQQGYKQLEEKAQNLQREYNVLQSSQLDLQSRLEKSEKRAEGLAEAVGRWRKKATGKDSKKNLVEQYYDGKYHRVSVIIPLPSESPVNEVWNIANADEQVKRQGYRLKKLRSVQDGWIATYEKAGKIF